MTDAATGAPEGEALSSIYKAAEQSGSVNDAVALMRAKREAPIPGDDAAQRAPAEQESAVDEAADATPPDAEAHGEAEGEIDPVGEPPIDPPRSWTKKDKETFNALPRETQQRLLDIDRARELEVRKGQNEVAEQRKAAEAAQKAAEQAKQQYEAALPQVAQLLATQHQSEFADIKTLADAEKLLKADPPRYMRWQLSQTKLAAAQGEAARQAQAQQAEAVKWYEGFVKAQDAKFIEAVPDYGDPVKAERLQKAAVETLTEIGFDEGELEDLMRGRKPLHARDHRVQLLVHKAAKWDQAQKAAATAKAKATPPVTRPGVAPDKGASKVAQVTEAQKQLARTGRVDDAVALLRAKRAI